MKRKKPTRCFFLVLICTLLMTFTPEIQARSRFKTKPKTKHYELFDIGERKVNVLVGMEIFKGSALFVGGQYGFEMKGLGGIYLGPEVNYALDSMLDSTRSIFMALAGAWYEVKVYSPPRQLGLIIEILTGLASQRGYQTISEYSYAFFVGLGVFQNIDSFVSIRGQFRPGMIGGQLASIINLSVCFRL